MMILKRGFVMGTKQAKQIVYRYNGIVSSEEVEQDLDGEVPVPPQNSVIVRSGKNWKVAVINWEVATDGRIPVLRLFLTDQF
jgi:hypothetical protein